jgi:SAM-dependent methyltransferase
MNFKGPEFYDNDEIYRIYTERRTNPENPNDTLEPPVLAELIGDVADLRIIDLGCGNALFGRQALEQGARSYLGLEPAEKMLQDARKMLAGTSGEVIRSTIEAWTYPPASADLVVSRLALHYVEDFNRVCRNVFPVLSAGGRFVFSVEHPVITSCFRSMERTDLRTDWIVDDYFITGERVNPWMGSSVIKYHRTVEDYFRTLQEAGFVVEALRESHPRREHFSSQETYERRLRIPLFLFFAARKGSRQQHVSLD